MVQHIIIWDLKDTLSPEEKKAEALKIKTGLESLQGKIDGLLEIKVGINLLPSSNGDVILLSSFRDEASLKGYQSHPEHLAVANGIVRPITQNRKCMDFVL